LNIQQTLGYQEVRESIGVTKREFEAALLNVGSEYVFFWGAQPSDNTACIVGGARGVFGFNPNTGIVSRLDTSVPSQIPVTQTLAQLETAINLEQKIEGSKPTPSPPPPVCDSSATGL
jgi:hypothetical protein